MRVLSSARALAGALCVLLALAIWSPSPAFAYSEQRTTGSSSPPWMAFERNNKSPQNAKLYAYVSIGKNRYRLAMRAGTGNGTSSECVRGKGQIPVGIYGDGDMDSMSHLQFIANKNYGNSVVRGAVWSLGAKKCIPKSGETKITRTDLYIHSEGTSGWTSNNYKSNGCIKINQTDRSQLAKRWKSSYRKSLGVLYVY